MEGSIERIQPNARIQPPGRERRVSEDPGRRRFAMGGDDADGRPDDAPPGADEPERAARADDERPVGHADDDEAGNRLDVTA